MSAALKAFDFETVPVRTLFQDNEPWFVGKDVCAALAIKNHNDALSRLEDDERAGSVMATQFGDKETIIVSEAGVYRLVFTSRTAAAERFKRWLAHEVLPALRRTGTFTIPAALAEGEADDGLKNATDGRAWGVDLTKVRVVAEMLRTVAGIYGAEAARRLYEAEPGLPPLRRPSPEADEIDRFFEACVLLAEGQRLPALLFYDTYAAWVAGQGGKPASSRAFGDRATARFRKREIGGRIFYEDIALAPPPA